MSDGNLINFSNIDQPIYRVIHLAHLYDLLKTGNLVLTRPHKWDDPFENCLLKLDAVEKLSGDKISIRGCIDIFFGLCWSLDTKETDATWRIYSPHKMGVRITTTVRKLLSALNLHEDLSKQKLLYFGKVKYCDANKIIKIITGSVEQNKLFHKYDGRALANLLLLKRKEFIHENEARLLFSDPSHTIPKYEPQCLLKINPLDLIDEIVFDPRILDTSYACYRDTLRFDFRVKIPIAQSQLYRIPTAQILIDSL